MLDYPNHEVRWSFMAHILETYAQMPRREIEVPKLQDALTPKTSLDNKATKRYFLKLLEKLFCSYSISIAAYKADEAYYHSLFQMVFTLNWY